MSGLRIHADRCVGCGLCVKSCPANALYMEDKKAKLGDGCILCGSCVDSCRLNAITMEREVQEIEEGEYSGIWVFIQQKDTDVMAVTLELLGKGRELADQKGCTLTAVGVGASESHSELLIAHGADRVVWIADASFDESNEWITAYCIAEAIAEEKPEIVLFGATALGRSLAPRIAARLHTGLTADCTILELDEKGLLAQTRPAFGGNLMATIVCPSGRPQMATVRPGIMTASEGDFSRKGQVICKPFPDHLPKKAVARLLHETSSLGETIADAQVIVCAGRGIGSQKNLKLAGELAEKLGGKLGVTRGLVDNGWADSSIQIGQTGFVVAPKLLISLGVSGAIQHLAGISSAEKIIAINSDPDASIFQVASYGIVGDCVAMLTELINEF